MRTRLLIAALAACPEDDPRSFAEQPEPCSMVYCLWCIAWKCYPQYAIKEMTTVSANPVLMELIQAHERGWGMEQYVGRPSLADMLSRRIVVFWSGEDRSGKGRFTVSVHDSADELNDIILSMIVASKVTPSTQRRLVRMFVDQKAVKVTGVRLLIEPSERK
jgi:hypothetical protein